MTGTLVRHILIGLVAVTTAVQAVEYTRERYEVIIERSPFGEDPLLAQEAAADAKEELEALAAAKKLEKDMRLCYLLETQSGEIRAGFQNLKAQAGDPKSIMLMVGESYKGMKLAAIDIANSSATLMLNEKPVTFELTKSAAPVAKPAAPAAPTRRLGGGFRSKPAEPAAPPEPQLSPEEQAKKREEVRENLRQYQMEVIRSGMPPLPIPLTKEMDDQLVAEGILPPGGE
ncbi:hypothetical protein P4E94_06525 [Pontiellaceae bacterium B12219]|nr:hypothetical protein [Pontiellaceae bacterium B12219]